MRTMNRWLALALGLGVAWGAEEPSAIFTERLNAYVKVRTQANAQVPAVGKNATPVDIDQREGALAEAIRKARPAAVAGNVFTPEVKAMFANLLRTSLTGPESADRRASIKEGNPKHDKAPGDSDPVIAVNGIYPKSAPLSTVPPSLLMKLPALPREIEYRFVGSTLLLLDSQSNLIIDYLKGAVPAR
jgi:hypothetical protein